MKKFIYVRSPKFPILPGEREELVNAGMFGKALAEYLKARLSERGYQVPFVCCEDWGWWVEIKGAPFAFGVCIYSGPEDDDQLDLYCTDGAKGRKQWSWRKFRFVETKSWVEKLHADLVSIFQADPEIELISTKLDSPL